MGFRISTEAAKLAMDTVWAEIAVAALAGSAFYGAVALAERAATFWHPFHPQNDRETTDEHHASHHARRLPSAALRRARPRQAPGRVTLQLKWLTQSQFAGYYVAQARGFLPPGRARCADQPGRARHRAAAGHRRQPRRRDRRMDARRAGRAGAWRAAGQHRPALQALRHDADLPRGDGIRTPPDLRGRTLGVWFSGNEYPFLAWMARLGYRTDGTPQGVRVLRQGFNVDPLLQRQADCVSTMTYNEYWQVIDGGFRPEQLQVFRYEEQGVATLEDGLYVLESACSDAAFVRAWPASSAPPCRAGTGRGRTRTRGAHRARQRRLRRPDRGAPAPMMGEIARLLDTEGGGRLVQADFDRTVQTLLSSGGDTPVITRAPTGAWTHAVMDAIR
jgi:NitT/TauT family transport system substrate-binding protein